MKNMTLMSEASVQTLIFTFGHPLLTVVVLDHFVVQVITSYIN